jgi:hypothetical protein
VAERTVVFSDLSGEAIEDGERATITIRFQDARRRGYVLDVTEAEAQELGQKGRPFRVRARTEGNSRA